MLKAVMPSVTIEYWAKDTCRYTRCGHLPLPLLEGVTVHADPSNVTMSMCGRHLPPATASLVSLGRGLDVRKARYPIG
jgi:hypothetical protein